MAAKNYLFASESGLELPWERTDRALALEKAA
jgi:hypothetical protein